MKNSLRAIGRKGSNRSGVVRLGIGCDSAAKFEDCICIARDADLWCGKSYDDIKIKIIESGKILNIFAQHFTESSEIYFDQKLYKQFSRIKMKIQNIRKKYKKTYETMKRIS